MQSSDNISWQVQLTRKDLSEVRNLLSKPCHPHLESNLKMISDFIKTIEKQITAINIQLTDAIKFYSRNIMGEQMHPYLKKHTITTVKKRMC